MASAVRTILIVDDDRAVAESHQSLVSFLGYNSEIECDPREVEKRLMGELDFALVLLDLRMPHLDGREVLRRIQVTRPEVGVVIATVVNDIEEAVQCIKRGAYNYLLKPIHQERLREVLESYFSNQPRCFERDPRFRSVITQSSRFQEIFKRISAFARQDVPILLEGETGSGKELFSTLTHSLSSRSSLRFVGVNVAAISKGLFESELFGHVRGAFTSATNAKAGYCDAAGEGTLFLDEIGELELEEQKKLLRIIQERRYCRVGETEERDLKCRLIFATNKNLKSEVEAGRFREDLYYRLSAHVVTLPPLRERREDIKLLAEYFLRKYRSQYSREVETMTPEAIAALENYPFPGNVRELEGIISAAVLLEDSRTITLASLPQHISSPNKDDTIEGHRGLRYRDVVSALNECNGNQRRAAEKLGIARETLNRMLRKYRERAAAHG